MAKARHGAPKDRASVFQTSQRARSTVVLRRAAVPRCRGNGRARRPCAARRLSNRMSREGHGPVKGADIGVPKTADASKG